MSHPQCLLSSAFPQSIHHTIPSKPPNKNLYLPPIIPFNSSLPSTSSSSFPPPSPPASLNHNPLTQPSIQAQTPQQRAANARFARSEEKKMGKPVVVKRKEDVKSPISRGWIS